MRRTFVFFIVAALALISAAPALADSPLSIAGSGGDWTVSVTRPSSSVYIGGFDVHLGFDPALLTYSSTDFGLQLGDPSLFEALTMDVPGTNEVNVLETSLLPPSFLATQPMTFDLFTVHFIPVAGVAPGIVSILASNVDLADQYGDPVGNPAVPEPGFWAQFLVAASGIAVLKRRLFA